MLEKLRQKNLYIYIVLVLLIFKIVQNLAVYPSVLLYKAGLYPTDDAGMTCFAAIVMEVVTSIVMIIILWRTNKLDLFKKKGKGFLRSLPLGGYQLTFVVFSFIALIGHILQDGAQFQTGVNILLFIVSMLMVGLAEELSCRAIVAESLLENYGTSKKGVWSATIISGMLFGLLHLTNLTTGQLIPVLIQTISACASGMLLAAIYFRSGNIWTMFFIHGLYDIGTSASSGILKGDSLASMLTNDGSLGVGALFMVLLVGTIPPLIVSLFLLRNKKIGYVKKYWPEIEEK